MEVIVQLYNSPNKRGFVKGKKQGTYVKQLSEKGWVIPAGKEKRRTRWELEKDFTPGEIKLMKDLIK